MDLNFNDFQKQDVKFDIKELQKAYKEILEIKNFSGPEGVTNFGAISLTQIPGDPDSIKGHKARGVFWTKPDGSGKEVVRDEKIDESKFSYEQINNFYFYPSKRWDLELKNGIRIKLSNLNLVNSLNKSFEFLNDENFRDIKTIDLRVKNQTIIK